MCGLVGIYAYGGSARVSHDALAAMRDTMAHRGPDGAGLWSSADGCVALAHRRLAIIDLSAAAGQPMTDEAERFCVVLNGEIYNHAELRRELEATGRFHWKTDHSDTEVVLHAFAAWGIDCLARFRGMFAVALWDAGERRLWLARDRLGIKPLYYCLDAGRVVFASEIKALLRDPERRRAVDEEALFHYLSFLTTPAPWTLFEGIRKLPPASWLCVGSDGSVRQARYWDVLENARPLPNAGEKELAELVIAELRTAVRVHKVGDVPMGVFLSGGVDSSTNAALFAEDAATPVKTFTIGYDDAYPSYPNECDYARRMADTIGAEYYERRLSLDDLLAVFPELVRLQDEPIADPVCIPVYYLAALARRHGVKVCQVGEGADELFLGYPSWLAAARFEGSAAARAPRLLQRLAWYGLRCVGRAEATYGEWLRRSAAGQPAFWGGAESFFDGRKRRLLSPRLRRRFSSLSSWEALEPIRSRFEAHAWDRSPLNWMSYLDLNLRLPELLLMRVDKMTMGVGVEARVPFLDHKVVELAMSIPAAAKVKAGPKYLLKKAVRGLVPDELVDRPKQGFGVPIAEWMWGRLGDTAEREITAFCRATDLLDPVEVRRLIARRASGYVWPLFNLAVWWKEFVAGAPTPLQQ